MRRGNAIFQKLRFIVQPKWWLSVLLIAGLTLIIGLPASRISAQAEITITPPTGKTEFFLAPQTPDQSLITTTGLVTSSVKFDLLVRDSMADSKPAGTAGHLTEWNGSSWVTDGKTLQNAVHVESSLVPGRVAGGITLTAVDQPIISGAKAGTDIDLKISVTQDTIAGDVALTEVGHWYRIVITFTASEAL